MRKIIKKHWLLQFQVKQLDSASTVREDGERDLRRKRRGMGCHFCSSEKVSGNHQMQHRKAASRFSCLSSLETEKIKHLKLDFSLWLILNIMVSLSQLEPEFRITRKLGITHKCVRV